MNAIDMIRRCARHGSTRGLSLAWQENVRRHDEQECLQTSDQAHHGATQTPNLLVWNGRSHLLAIEFREDLFAPFGRGAAKRAEP